MEWLQVFTVIASLLASIYVFYQLTEKKIDKIEENINRLDDRHRQDIKDMDAKWENLFNRMDSKLEKMDDRWKDVDRKWEHLFEMILTGKTPKLKKSK